MHKHYLWEKLGPLIREGLDDENVFEIMLNPDGQVWFKYKSNANVCAGHLEEHEALSFVHAIAKLQEQYLSSEHPYLDAELPFQGERINITMPPICERVSFNIRKKASQILTLGSYVEKNIMTEKQSVILMDAIIARKNILVSGSPASGKTTLTNALLDAIAIHAKPGERILLLEQVRELQCRVENIKRMCTSEKTDMNTLLWLSMRNSPDRIVIGEVRDGAALAMLKAWNTGCAGGIATIHANHSMAAIQRVLDLASEVVQNPPFRLALEALDILVHIQSCPKHPAKRRVSEICEVKGFDAKTQTFHIEQLDS